MNRRVVFCANQISLCIASELLKNKKDGEKIFIFYDEIRCDINAYAHVVSSAFRLNRYNFGIFFLYFYFFGINEIIVPHLKWEYARLFSKVSKSLSYIDDGLDTFRMRPNNIDISTIKDASSFYTFDYKFKLAPWIYLLKLIKLPPITNLAISNKQSYDFGQYENVVVESPGVESFFLNSNDLTSTILIRHSNPNKHIVSNYRGPMLLGSSIALEASLLDYRGTIHIGESMVFIFLASVMQPRFKINLYLKANNQDNNLPLLELCKNMSNLSVIVSEG